MTGYFLSFLIISTISNQSSSFDVRPLKKPKLIQETTPKDPPFIPPPNTSSSPQHQQQQQPYPFFSFQLSQIQAMRQTLLSILFYKPPLGITFIAMLFRILFLRGTKPSSSSALETAELEDKKRKRKGRSLDLDVADDDYKKYGGVENVRAEICGLALSSSQQEDDDVVEAAKEALKMSSTAGGSRWFLVRKLSEPMAKLHPVLLSTTSSKEYSVLRHASRVAEVRALDALLRILRDRLLISSARLRRAHKHWTRRVGYHEGGWGKRWKRWARTTILRATLEDDRRNLAVAAAAYHREIGRLGEVQEVMLTRPAEMEEHVLLELVAKDVEMKTEIALKTLDGDKDWINQSTEWTVRARKVICSAISASLSGLQKDRSSPVPERDSTVSEDAALIDAWCSYQNANEAETWKSILYFVDNFAKSRRIGEARYYIINDVFRYTRQWDFFKIPSSVMILFAAYHLHNTIQPHWPKILTTFHAIKNAIWGIIEFRFYHPLRDIILDLLNRRPRMLDPYALLNEETSLDNMLKDIGAGDGSKADRARAIATASRMYEEELVGGPIRGFFRGRMLRLLLIQVQQLKAGLLKAMDSIDDLVDANRLNVQLLASIPAFLMVYYGTKFLGQGLYSLRTRDLRPTWGVHKEMEEVLEKMERCLLLAGHEVEAKEGGTTIEMTYLRKKELGEFLLLVHSYLILLDYCSPPFPKKACDSIHMTLQSMLIQGMLTTRRQIDLLRLIKSKHANLIGSM